jgi:hypothetical protein
MTICISGNSRLTQKGRIDTENLGSFAMKRHVTNDLVGEVVHKHLT